MKHHLMAMMMTMSGFAVAASPNLFTCVGEGLQVSYTTTSFVGQPTMNVKLGAGGSRSFMGQQIQTQNTVLGKLVTVTKQVVPDLKVETYSLIVPDANLTNRTPEVTFDTALVETLSRTSIGGPRLVQGVITSNQFHPVKCTGKKVFF